MKSEVLMNFEEFFWGDHRQSSLCGNFRVWPSVYFEFFSQQKLFLRLCTFPFIIENGSTNPKMKKKMQWFICAKLIQHRYLELCQLLWYSSLTFRASSVYVIFLFGWENILVEEIFSYNFFVWNQIFFYRG